MPPQFAEEEIKASEVMELVQGHTSGAGVSPWVGVPHKTLILSPVTAVFCHSHERFFSIHYVTGLGYPRLKTYREPNGVPLSVLWAAVDTKQTRKR